MIEINYSEMEQQARDKGVPFAEILRRAELNYATWYRWKTGATDPVNRINSVYRELEKLDG